MTTTEEQEVPRISHEVTADNWDKAAYKAEFKDEDGKEIEVHDNFALRFTFEPQKYFDKDAYQCPSCQLFMHCTTQREQQTLDICKIVPCGVDAATQRPIPRSDNGGLLALFMRGKVEPPILLRVSDETLQAVQPKDLMKRFDKLAAIAEITPRVTGLLFDPIDHLQQTPYFMFAALTYMQGIVDEKLKQEQKQ